MRFIRLTAVLAAFGLLAGCATSKPTTWKYPPPVFDTHRPPPHYTPRPLPAPPPRSSMAPGEPGWLPPGGIKGRWTDIVLHHSASAKGGAKSFDKYHRTVRKWDELGYHFVIGNGSETRDGQIEVGPRWTKQKHGAHCKTPNNYYNDHGIGICLVGDFNKTAPTRAQLASLHRLLVFLTERCRIGPDHIRTHGGITHATQCPGKRFPLAGIERSLSLSQRRMAQSPARQRPPRPL